jgi:transcriptional regulator with XRE-family HTH domain
MDDLRVGRILRALRRRRGWRQVDLSAASGVSQSAISLMERGHWSSLSVDAIRRVFAALDASFDGIVSWRGGSIDRLLDERHARVVERIVAIVQGSGGWDVAIEATFQHYGERGSIDVLAVNRGLRIALVIEAKSELTSVEETLRRLDVKERLAPIVCTERFGWQPATVARCLVVAESDAARRRVASHERIFAAALPERSWSVRRWLRQPGGRMSGLWFLSISNASGANGRGASPSRIMRRKVAASYPA